MKTTTSTNSHLHPWAVRLALLLFIGFTVVQTSGQSPATGAIEGRVFNATDGAALRNVVVSLEGTSLQAVTDDDGTYRSAGVPAGVARLAANYLGFAGHTVAITVPPGGTVARDLELSPRAGDEPVRLGEFTVVADREKAAARGLSASC